MHSRHGTWLTIVLLTLAASRVSAQTSTTRGASSVPRTAEDVIALNVEARGGAARIASVTTTHLQTKWQGTRVMGGQPVTFESLFSDYRPIDGVMFAHRIESRTLGGSGGQVITLDSVRVNVPNGDDRFRMPGAPRHN